jgi:ribose transport system substrate-binding protein
LTKDTNLSFFKEIKNGCKEAAQKLNHTCTFIEMNEGNPRLQIRKLLKVSASQEIDGLAIAIIKSDFTAREINKIKEIRGIPLVTIDADFKTSDLNDHGLKRISYIGTDNYQLGFRLGKELLKGFKVQSDICIISGHSYSKNLNLRIKGFKDALKINKKKIRYLNRCPLYTLEKPSVAVGQVSHMANEAISNKTKVTIALMGGWAQENYNKYRQSLVNIKKYIDNGDVRIVSIDTLPNQVKLLNEGYGHINVGQKPKEMGRIAFKTLLDAVHGKNTEEFIYIPSRVCIPNKCK